MMGSDAEVLPELPEDDSGLSIAALQGLNESRLANVNHFCC